MAFGIGERIKQTTTTTGTGPVTLIAATGPWQNFAVASGTDVAYLLQIGADWEVGVGTVTLGASDTLSRDTVIASSNGGALVNFPSGTKDVVLTLPAAHLKDLLDWTGAKGLLARTVAAAAGITYVARAIVGGAGITVTNGTGEAGDPTVALDQDTAAGLLPEPGDVTASLRTAKTGWVRMDDGTIGNGASGATTRANDDCRALFAVLWAIPDTYTPFDPPAARGADADADFDAGKKIYLTTALGRMILNAGQGSGLTDRPLGSSGGEEDHTPVIPEMAVHDHGIGQPDMTGPSPGGAYRSASGVDVETSTSRGGGDPFNVTSAYTAMNLFAKL